MGGHAPTRQRKWAQTLDRAFDSLSMQPGSIKAAVKGTGCDGYNNLFLKMALFL